MHFAAPTGTFDLSVLAERAEARRVNVIAGDPGRMPITVNSPEELAAVVAEAGLSASFVAVNSVGDMAASTLPASTREWWAHAVLIAGEDYGWMVTLNDSEFQFLRLA